MLAWIAVAAAAGIAVLFAGFIWAVFFYKSYFVVRNQSDREIQSIEMIITHGTNTPAERDRAEAVGSLGPGAELKHRFSTGDGLLRIAYVDSLGRHEVKCGYVSSMLTDYLITVPQTDPPTCRLLKHNEKR